MATETVRIGRIVGAFGLKGHVKVEPMTDFLSRFEMGTQLLLRGEWVEVEEFRLHKGRPLLKLAGVNDATAAEALQWEYLEGSSKEEVELDEDEFLTEDLIGLRVVTSSGEELGEVEDVIPFPAQDVLQVGEIMIPAVKEFVKDVDLDGRTITVELIPGMMPGES